MSPLRRCVLTVLTAAALAGHARAQVPTRDLVAALIESLRDADGEVRAYAAMALAAVGSEAVEPLVATLADKNPNLAPARAAAAYALGEMGTPATPATAALVKALKDDATDVRRQAAQAISRILSARKYPNGSLVPPQRPGELEPPPPAIPPREKPPT